MTAPRAIVSQAILTSLRSRSDGSLGVSFSTPELTAEEKVAWFYLQNKNLRLLLEPVDSSPEPPIEVKGKMETKTPSQRIRAVLYMIFMESGSSGRFEDFYAARTEKILEKLRDELDTLKS